jgi:hypothetical protein
MAASLPVVERVVGDQPSEGTIVAGDGFGYWPAWAVFGFVVETVSEWEDVHLVVVQLECFPHVLRP